MFAYTLTPTSLNILYKGRMRTLHSSSPHFYRAVELVKNPAADPTGDELDEILDIRSFIAKVTFGRVQITDDEVRVNGKPAHGYVIERTLAMLREGFDVLPLAHFIDKLQDNPTSDVREDLWKWLENGKMPLCLDGDFIAFKAVRPDYFDHHSQRFDHHVGQSPTMPREACDDDRNSTCSRGLHFCSFEYLSSYMSSGDRLMIVKINPANVVAIPTDYNLSKGRCCGYEVIAEVAQEDAEKVRGGPSIYPAAGAYTSRFSPEDGEDEAYEGEAYEDDVVDDIHADDCDEADDTPMLYGDEVAPTDAVAFTETAPIKWVDVTDRIAAGKDLPPIWLIRPEYDKVTNVAALGLAEVIGGDPAALLTAFPWASSPQGRDYWDARQEGAVKLSEDDLTWLRGLHAFHTKQDVPTWATVPEYGAVSGAHSSPLRRAINGNHYELRGAFVWDTTPQGHEYWSDRTAGRAALNDHDIAWLRGLLSYHGTEDNVSWVEAMRND